MIFTVAYGAVDVWALGFQAIFVGLILILWCLESFFTKEFRYSPSLLQIPLIALILIGLVQFLPFRDGGNSLSLDSYSTRFAVIQLIIYLVFFATALVFINSRKRLQRLVVSIIIFASIMAFVGILQYLAKLEAIYGLRLSGQAIPFASFVNQHHFAAFMEMSIGLTTALLFGKAVKKDKNLLLIIAAVIMGIALILTSSRGGFLSLLGVLAFIITANLLGKKEGERSSGFRRNFALIGGGVALGRRELLREVFQVFLLGGDQSLLRGTGLQNAGGDLLSGRTHFWQTALKIFLDYPIFGVGLNAFGTAFPNYDTWNGTLRVEQAHNDYLQMLTEAGIVGFLCVTGFVFLLFKKTLRTLAKTTD
ncbi:MAG TPA: O-antigen ligase family protein, partial [Pyrinomonadaceae bacterium]|nr:O-antigen ligase family protein [Pyrinomonadaceae bacterium]